jgi:hypothetical protein
VLLESAEVKAMLSVSRDSADSLLRLADDVAVAGASADASIDEKAAKVRMGGGTGRLGKRRLVIKWRTGEEKYEGKIRLSLRCGVRCEASRCARESG